MRGGKLNSPHFQFDFQKYFGVSKFVLLQNKELKAITEPIQSFTAKENHIDSADKYILGYHDILVVSLILHFVHG